MCNPSTSVIYFRDILAATADRNYLIPDILYVEWAFSYDLDRAALRERGSSGTRSDFVWRRAFGAALSTEYNYGLSR